MILKLIFILSHSHWYDRHFKNHTGHIGGSSQREWIGEYTVLEGGRWEMIERNLWQKNRVKQKIKQNYEKIQKTGCTSQETNPVNGW